MKTTLAAAALLAIIPVRSVHSADTQRPIKKVLFVGDSITAHGPASNLGWSGNWGMAASSESKDYVHLFLAKLAAAQGGKQAEFRTVAAGGGKVPDKLSAKDEMTRFAPDLAIVQLGENDKENIDQKGFQAPYEDILVAIRKGNPDVRLLCLGVWSPPNGSATKDALIRSACGHHGATFVDLQAANRDPANRAAAENRSTNAGVNWHPGDRGMEAYANALWSAWLAPAKAPAAALPNEQVSFVIEERWSGPSQLSWKPAPDVRTPEREAAALVQSLDANTTTNITAALPLATVKGQSIRLETKVKAENVSEKPSKWNGIKLMLVITNAEGEKNYPQRDFVTGTFDWETVSWTVNIPDNTTSVSLVLGLEKVSGKVWFGPLKILPN